MLSPLPTASSKGLAWPGVGTAPIHTEKTPAAPPPTLAPCSLLDRPQHTPSSSCIGLVLSTLGRAGPAKAFPGKTGSATGSTGPPGCWHRAGGRPGQAHTLTSAPAVWTRPWHSKPSRSRLVVQSSWGTFVWPEVGGGCSRAGQHLGDPQWGCAGSPQTPGALQMAPTWAGPFQRGPGGSSDPTDLSGLRYGLHSQGPKPLSTTEVTKGPPLHGRTKARRATGRGHPNNPLSPDSGLHPKAPR